MLISKRPLGWIRRLGGAAVVLAVCGGVLGGSAARGQGADLEPREVGEEIGAGGLSPSDEARLQLLSDPDALKKKADGKDRTKPPIEIYRSQIAPNDVVPWIKTNQWAGLSIELQANDGNYDGALQSLAVPLVGPPYEMIYTREARLVKEQRARLGMPILVPTIPREKEVLVELRRPEAIRADALYSVPLKLLPPHQMLVMVLSREANDAYAAWSRFSAVIPATFDRGDALAVETARYYRMLLPLEVDRPFLPTHPLTWGAISHVVWDGMAPDVLSTAQQSALLDWLHWGGQLVVVGGAGPSSSIFRGSFLEPYLPADPTGEGRLLAEADLRSLSDAYPPPFHSPTEDEPAQPGRRPARWGVLEQLGMGYLKPEPIRPAAGRPVYIAGLQPRDGARTIPMGTGSPNPLAVEWRVGRGRITMLTVNPTDPALAAWGGIDTMVRRVVLRRPEEAAAPLARLGETYGPDHQNLAMGGPDLSWYRIAARDVGARPPDTPPSPVDSWRASRRRASARGAGFARVDYANDEPEPPRLQGVAEWVDSTGLPRTCRDALERASGITVPSSQFVLRVILAYLLAVVPLNWLVCRYVLGRREAAWIVVPLLALGFAVGVERVAAYDMGYDSACDEIDLLEVQGSYPRGHLSRFASLYSTGRNAYAIRFPDDPTALILPMDTGRSIAGEDRTTAVWRAYPVPALEDFAVQPRSLAMFRAEETTPLPGSVALEIEGGRRTLRNDLGLDLHDAAVVDFSDPGMPVETRVGTIAAGATVELAAETETETDPDAAPAASEDAEAIDGPDPGAVLAVLRKSVEDRPESVGELRLTAWARGPVSGPRFEPALDRHRGVTVVVVHLRYPPPPSPASRRYNLLAPPGAETEAR